MNASAGSRMDADTALAEMLPASKPDEETDRGDEQNKQSFPDLGAEPAIAALVRDPGNPLLAQVLKLLDADKSGKGLFVSTGARVTRPTLRIESGAARVPALAEVVFDTEPEGEPLEAPSPWAPGEAVLPTTEYRPAMVYIPAGRFIMGSSGPLTASIDETPAHPVRLSAFLMAATPVTFDHHSAINGKTYSHIPTPPVTGQSWYDAVDYCNTLSEREGVAPAYEVHGEDVRLHPDRDGYRLPSEAQWEYACRAGSADTAYWFDGDWFDGRVLDIEDVGWVHDNSAGRTHVVGEKTPNPWGLYDVHGNVWEWCDDWYGPYAKEAQSDPHGPQSGTARVLRGGSYFFDAHRARARDRQANIPGDRLHDVGLRPVRPISDALLRLPTLLAEFEGYRISGVRKIEHLRTEVVRAGFRRCHHTDDYQTIVDVGAKLPDAIWEDEYLDSLYKNAKYMMRRP